VFEGVARVQIEVGDGERHDNIRSAVRSHPGRRVLPRSLPLRDDRTGLRTHMSTAKRAVSAASGGI
jgi:hypothetical protein